MPSRSSTEAARQQSDSYIDTDTESDTTDQPQLSGIVEEGEVSDHDQDPTADPDQAL